MAKTGGSIQAPDLARNPPLRLQVERFNLT